MNKQVSKMDSILSILCILLLISGYFSPMVTFQKFWIYSNTYSLWSGTFHLINEGNYFIFVVIFCFSILFPFLKLLTLLQLMFIDLTYEKREKRIHWLMILGKWSMLDVFVIALLLMSIKLGEMGKVEIHFGTYAFSLYVILSMVLTQKLKKSSVRASQKTH